MTSELSNAAGGLVRAFTWLWADALFLFLLLAWLLAYKDLDEPMRHLLRIFLVAFWGYVSISSVHIWAYVRRSARTEQPWLPRWVGLTAMGAKLALLSAAAVYAYSQRAV